MIEFSVEKYQKVIPEMMLLYPAHWAEVRLEDPLEVDYEAYDATDKRGLLHVVTARANGKLVGYHVVLVVRPLHHKGMLFAYTDIIYLSKPFRKGMNGVKFIKFACEYLKTQGVNRFLTMATPKNPFYGVLEWLGFSERERIYSKVL